MRVCVVFRRRKLVISQNVKMFVFCTVVRGSAVDLLYLSRECGHYCHSSDMMMIKWIMELRPKTDDVIDLCTLVNK